MNERVREVDALSDKIDRQLKDRILLVVYTVSVVSHFSLDIAHVLTPYEAVSPHKSFLDDACAIALLTAARIVLLSHPFRLRQQFYCTYSSFSSITAVNKTLLCIASSLQLVCHACLASALAA